MQHLVFVYGTLRKGQSNAHYLSSCELLGSFETQPEFALYDLGAYPGIISGKKSVSGEVYMVDDEVLKQLDVLEDIPVEYRRETIQTDFGPAWVYIYQLSTSQNGSEIISGDWCQRV